MSSRRFIPRVIPLLTAIVLAIVSPHAAGAQQVDVIRGRVTGPDSLPVENVVVTVTSISGNVNRTGKTDRQGRYSITFPNGDGNYMVNFAAMGYAAKRFEIRRVADEDFLLADAKLARVGAVLDQLNVAAARDKVSRNANDMQDIGGTERSINTSAVLPDMMGDLAAMAATLPGVQLAQGADGANGYSVLGLGSDQNSTTLNGLNFGGAGLPRDASISTSLTTSPYDVSRGGFSGAQQSIRTGSGNNFLRRRLSTSLAAPQLQWTDRIGRSLGNEYTNADLGGAVSGPLVFDKAFYNISYQLGRRANDLQTLLNTQPSGLQAAGVSSDSVTRLTSVLATAGVPSGYSGLPGNRLQDQGSILGSLDFTPPSSTRGSAWNVTFSGAWGHQNPASDFGSSSARSLPTAFGDRTNFNGGLQARHSSYFGFGVLTETSVGISTSSSSSSPFVDLPSGRVRVNSDFADGTSGVQMLTFGGNQSLGTSTSSSSLMATNMLSWFSLNNKHRLKLTSELRVDGSTQDLTTNRLGTFTYNSLADLESGHAASYTRQLLPRERDVRQVVGAVSLGDSYRRTPNLQLQYGVRVDANQYLNSPSRNTAVEERFGIRNDNVPNRVFVSPRVGFSWTYGTAAQIASFAGAFRGPRAMIRGGIGVFQNQPNTNMIGSSIDNTGLPTGIQQLVCVGSAVPAANWSTFSNGSNIPDRCADGSTGTQFSNGAPNVSLFAKDFATPRSLRSNLSWSGPVLNARYNLSVDGTYSLNMQQGGFVDRNFSNAEQFTLANEGGRPVYAPIGSIIPTTGAIAAGASRIDQAFGRVTEQRSDLTSMSRQLTARLSPMAFNNNLSWSVAYTYSNVREQFQGFQSTASTPLAREWSRSGFDSRHQLMYNLSYNAFDFVRISWNGQFRSGTPFTPGVGGDINGDGYSNDRAYVFDPASTQDAALRAGMQALLDNGSPAARDCLASQLGRVAARNSCQNPWTQGANLSFSFNPLKVRMPQRATLSFAVQNPLGAADLLVNGENKLRGWGQQPFADPSLLYVRGFDPVSRQYKYEVNQRFGATSQSLNAQRNPVILSAFLRFDIGPATERQLLTQSLDRGRRRAGDKSAEQMLKLQFGNNVIANPMATILRDQDTLKLTSVQADSLASMNRRYMVRLDSIWSPVAKWWATLPDNYNQDEAYSRYRRAREATVDMMLGYAPIVKKLLNDEQYRRLPPFVATALDNRYLKSIRSGTAGTGNGAMGMPMVMMGGGGTFITSGGGAQVIMR